LPEDYITTLSGKKQQQFLLFFIFFVLLRIVLIKDKDILQENIM